MKCIITADKAPKKNKTKGWYGNYQLNSRHTLVENQLFYLNKVFKDQEITIIYVYGFDKKGVERFFLQNQKKLKNISLIFNKEHERFGQTHSVGLGCEQLGYDNLLVLSGTTILKSSYFLNFETDKSYVFTGNKESLVGCSKDCFDKVEHISYDLDNGLHDIFHFNQNSIDSLYKITTSHYYRNHFLFEIINKMITTDNQDFYTKETKISSFKNKDKIT